MLAVIDLALGADGHFSEAHGTVRFVDISNPRGSSPTMATLRDPGQVTTALVSPDRRTLATPEVGARPCVCGTSLTRTARSRQPPLTGQPVTAAAYSPDGRTLITAGADLSVHVWDVTDPR